MPIEETCRGHGPRDAGGGLECSTPRPPVLPDFVCLGQLVSDLVATTWCSPLGLGLLDGARDDDGFISVADYPTDSFAFLLACSGSLDA